MHVAEIIRKKRDGGELTRQEIDFVISGFTSGDIPDYQVASWLMTIFLQGMNSAERAALTESMLHSGEVLDFSDLPAMKVDKHSTGGVGDKTSLILAPLVAAAGLYVPMISGRGLGHTGGTLDKLESIPGFNVNLSLPEFRRVLEKVGCAMIGQTAEIAPADKGLYALRDVIAAVESIPLICASIMSKKLAEGIDALVLDVKTGDGAFMKQMEKSVALAEVLVETGERMGKRTVALITDMDQPLGNAIGNSLEVEECISVMRDGKGPDDLVGVTVELAAWMLYLGGAAKSVDDGRSTSRNLLASGRVLEKFCELVTAHGGDPRVCSDSGALPQAKHKFEVRSQAEGTLTKIQCERIGAASVVLGGGRMVVEDLVDPAVGIVLHRKVRDHVASNELLCTVHYNSKEKFESARALLDASFEVGADKPAPRPLIHRVIQKGN
jgi:pyrimidine-nucleoside phosphorylase/thymidine phosphorylase